MSTEESQTEQIGTLTSFKAELTFDLSGMPLMDSDHPGAIGQFQFEPQHGSVHFQVIKPGWTISHVNIYGPRRLANDENSKSTNGHHTVWPEKEEFPDWLADLIRKAGVLQFPQNY